MKIYKIMYREDIHIISRHSNWSETNVSKALHDNVNNDAHAWGKFIKLFLLALGVSFTSAGIIFFFAYNWAGLHKFVQIGAIETAIISAIAVVIFSKLNNTFKNTILTGTSMLVGVLFAVFGQIYQTGANAYDFFLGWTVFVTLWVIVSNFAPLWMVFLVLINTTILLYSQQVAYDWSEAFVSNILFGLNATFLVIALFISHITLDIVKIPTWFTKTIALKIMLLVSTSITGIIFSSNQANNYTLILSIVACTIGILYGLKTHSVFYLSIISLSIIYITSAFLIRISDDIGMFFFISLFIIGSVTLVIKTLLNLQKKWTNA